MAVFHWVVVDVRDVIFKVAFVADGVLPEAALPYGIFAMRVCGERRITFHHRARESRFDQRPRRRVVSVTIWHCPNRMCKWSGSTQIATVSIPRSATTERYAERKSSTHSTSIDERRSANVTVKKYVPPGTKLRRY
jgi:hypothetical protein